MAKSNDNNKNTVEGIIEHPLESNGSITIDKDDVIAIAVTQSEAFMQEQIEKVSNLLEETKNEANDLEAEIKKDRLEHAKRACSKQLSSICKQYEKLGMSATVDYHLAEFGDCVELRKFRNRQEADDRSKQFAVRVELSLRHSVNDLPDNIAAVLCGDNEQIMYVVLETPTAVQKKIDRLSCIRKDAEDDRKDLMAWKRRLTQVPQLERSYKARLAQHRLSQSSQGQAILKQLTDSIEKDVLALPSK